MESRSQKWRRLRSSASVWHSRFSTNNQNTLTTLVIIENNNHNDFEQAKPVPETLLFVWWCVCSGVIQKLEKVNETSP